MAVTRSLCLPAAPKGGMSRATFLALVIALPVGGACLLYGLAAAIRYVVAQHQRGAEGNKVAPEGQAAPVDEPVPQADEEAVDPTRCVRFAVLRP